MFGRIRRARPHKSSGAATETAPETCTVCGFIITPALEHKTHVPRPEWVYDAQSHWHKCAGCEEQKLESAAHVFDGVCDTTCGICAYTREVEHDFEGGKCKICGECSHEILFDGFIDLSYNTDLCVDGIRTRHCYCEKAHDILDPYGLLYSGDCFFESVSSDDLVDEQGAYRKSKYECYNCDLTLDVIYRVKDLGNCLKSENYVITISFNGTVLIENATGENLTYKHGDTTNIESDMAEEYGICGGTYYTEVCNDCGETVRNDMYNWDCDIYYNGASTSEQHVDDDGTVHYITTYTCRVCGSKYISDQYYVYPYPCKEIYTTEEYLLMNGEEIYRDIVPSTTEYEDHDFEYTYILEGEKCEDGITYSAACKNCPEKRDPKHSPSHVSEDLIIYFEEFGVSCGGYIWLDLCGACGIDLSAPYVFVECDTEEVEAELDEFSALSRCKNCNLTFFERLESTAANCVETINCEFKITGPEGETVFEYKTTIYLPDHELDEQLSTWVLHGDSCTDGVTLTQRCANCDYSEDYSYNVHRSITIYDASWYGDFCKNHSFYVKQCACGSYGDFERYPLEDSDGEYSCYYCPYKAERTTQTVYDGCIATKTMTYKIYDGENLADTYIDTIIEYDHEVEFSATVGEGGEFEATTACKKCGIEKYYDLKYTSLVWSDELWTNIYDFDVKIETTGTYTVFSVGSGDTTVTLYELVGEDWKQIIGDDDSGSGDNFALTATLTAGKTYRFRMSQYYSNNFMFGMVEGEPEFDDCYHENLQDVYAIEADGVSCTDGVIGMTVCRDCLEPMGYSVTYEHNQDQGRTTIEAATIGACEGSITYGRCICGKSFSIYGGIVGCFTSDYPVTRYEEIDGIKHTITELSCDTCSTVVTRENYDLIEGCDLNTYLVLTITVNGEKKLELDGITNTKKEHDYIRTYEFDGERDCASGVTFIDTCSRCSDVKTRHYNECIIVTTYHENSEGFVSCGGDADYLHTGVCPCGKESYLYDYLSCFGTSETVTYTDGEQNLHTKVTEDCSKCDIKKVIDSYYVLENCVLTEYYSATYYLGETVLFENFVYKKSYDRHNMRYEFVWDDPDGELNCENGVTVNKVCLDCDTVFESEHITSHQRYSVIIDHLNYDICIGSYFEVHTCPCGFNSYEYIGLDNCEMQGVHSKHTENGREYDITEKECINCGFIVTEGSYKIMDGCNGKKYNVFEAAIGEQQLYSTEIFIDTFERHGELTETYAFATEDENCESGITVTVSCVDCGMETDKYNIDYHLFSTVAEYNLAGYGACGGKIQVNECMCGAQSSVNKRITCSYGTEYDYYVDDATGFSHETTVITCETCGLKLEIDQWYDETGWLNVILKVSVNNIQRLYISTGTKKAEIS